MSTTIDQRIVEMRFDNKQFEDNVQTSLSTLDKLKQSLDLSGAAKGLEHIGDASKTCDLSGLNSAVETVKVQFSALEVMAITALTNITNSAINTGKQLIQSLTTDQLVAGWDKYADKTSAVQTIMAATAKDFEDTGEQMEYVNEQLGKLNWFTDETSYSFLDMVSNIGKFTSNNIGLEQSVTAMQGISTWAAISGANVNEAGRAMYNLSQAIAVGAVKLMDWKSIENANMATAEFKQTVIDTAVELGTLVKTGDGVYQTMQGHAVSVSNFNDALSDAWFTADVLLTTLDAYGGFTNKLYEASEMTGLTATELLQAIDSYKNGELSIKELADDTGISVESLTSMMEELSDETFDLGQRSFRAAQEAKTFREAIDSVKEAVSTGWMNTFEIIFGDYEEAKTLWTDLANAMYDAFAAGAETRNAILEEWKSLGGRDVLIEAFWNAWEGVASIITPIKEAFRDIFPETTAQRLLELTEKLRDLTEKFKLSETASENLKNTFKGFFAVLDIMKQAFSAIFSVVAPLLGIFVDLSGGVLGVTGRFGEWLANLDEAIKKGNIFNGALQGVSTGIVGAATAVRDFVTVVKEKFNLPGLNDILEAVKKFLNVLKENVQIPGIELFHSLLERVHERMSQINEASGQMKIGVSNAIEVIGTALTNSKLFHGLEAIWMLVKNIASGIAKVAGEFMNNLVGAFANADFDSLLDIVNALSLGAIASALKNLTSGAKHSSDVLKNLKDTLKDALNGVSKIFDSVRGSLEAFQNNLNASTLLKIAGAVGVLAASILVLSTIDSDKLNTSLGAMTVMFADLMASMAIFTKISGDAKGLAKSAAAMMAVSSAVLILASALKKIGDLDVGQIASGLVGIAGLTTIVVASAKAMSNSTGATIKAAASMVIFAEAVKILAGVCEMFKDMSLDEMAKGLVGVGVLLAEIDIFLNTAKFSGGSIATATSIVILAGAMNILESACEDFAGMNWGEIVKGLVGIGAILAEVSVFTKAMGESKHVLSSALALIEIGAAMKIFASAMGDFGGMDWDQIAKGLVAMGGALAEMAIAVNFLPKNMIGIGTGLVVLGGALEIIANVFGKMGNLSWDQIAKGLVAMGGAMAELAVGLNFMTGTLAGSAAMIVAAGALAVLTPVLSVLGAMSWTSIAKGLITIAGAFTVIGIAGAVLTPLVPVILGLAGSFALIGVGVAAVGAGLLAAGAGLSALAVGFAALAAAGTAGATAVVAALTVIVTGVASLIPAVIAKIGEGVIEICKVIAASASEIGAAFKAVVLTLVDVLVECVPPIVDGAFVLVTEVMASLVQYTPQLVDLLFQFLIGVIDGVAQNLPELIQAAVNLLMAFFSGIVDALSGIDVDVLVKGIAGIGLLSAIMLALGAVASLVPAAMAGVLGMGVVIAELALVLAAVGALAQIPGLNWLIGEGGNLLQSIGTAIGQFIGGIVGGFMGGVSSQFPKIGQDLSDFMVNAIPFIEGAKSFDASALDGVVALTKAVMLITAADLLKGITSWITGRSSIADFGEQLIQFGESIVAYSNIVAGNIDSGAITASANAGKVLAELASSLPNSGGIAGFFAGENDINDFGNKIIVFGEAIAQYSETVSGRIDANAVTTSANAGKVLAELASSLPNTGGLVGWFAGNNDIDTFGEMIVSFGKSMAEYSKVVSGNVDGEAVTTSANAGKVLTELAAGLPAAMGVVTWFSSNSDINGFADQLVPFGEAIVKYSDVVSGNVDANSVTASATAGRALVELANTLPNTGGVVSWFTGNKDIEVFGEKIVAFGEAMAAYSDTVNNRVNAEAILASTNAGQAMVELANTLPKSGDIVNWFTGNSKFDTFGNAIVPFGEAMARYSDAVSNKIDSEAIVASVTAGSILVELSGTLPKTGDIVNWFTGNNKFETFGNSAVLFGKAMARYSEAVANKIDADAITASVTAGSVLVELSKTLPSTGGLMSWFSGESSFDKFAEGVIPFGEAMAAYSNIVSGKIDAGSITASATAGQALIELAKTLPSRGGVISWFSEESSLDKFSETIIPFGRAMAQYSAAVSGKIDAESINASAVAGRALVELAGTLPGITSVVGWFSGNNDLSNFGKSIVPFGAAIASYSSTVSGNIDSDAIEASATAGKALVELANTLPNTSGVIAWLTGNDVGAFGAKIVSFGETIAAYSSVIAGNVDPEAVTASTIAGRALVELGNTLPNTGGLVSWFAGERDLSSFGAGLVSFGESFAVYAGHIGNINADVLTATTNAAASIVELQNSLPKQGGWFSDNTSLADFGNDLSLFGSYFSTYYGYISEINTNKLAAVIVEANNLVAMASSMAGLDVSGMSSFGSALTALGQTGIDGFISAFTGATSRASEIVANLVEGFVTSANGQRTRLSTAFVSLMDTAISAMVGKQYQFNVNGQDVMTQFINGVNSKSNSLNSTVTTVLQNAITTITKKNQQFNTSGATVMTQFASGINSKTSEVTNAFVQVVNNAATKVKGKNSEFVLIGQTLMTNLSSGVQGNISAVYNAVTQVLDAALSKIKSQYPDFTNSGKETVTNFSSGVRSSESTVRQAFASSVSAGVETIRGQQNQFYSAGAYLVDGFANGINANTYKAAAQARAMATAAATAATSALKIQSPSKVFYGIGNYAGLGFVGALTDYQEKSYEAGTEIAESAKTGLTNALQAITNIIDNSMDMEPTIRPVLDLSNVADGISSVDSLLYSQRAFSLAGQASLAFGSTGDGDKSVITVNNDDVVQELRTLRGEMAAMTEKMEHMQVVLDSGRLVGELTDPLDSALGRKQTYRGRGI